MHNTISEYSNKCIHCDEIKIVYHLQYYHFLVIHYHLKPGYFLTIKSDATITYIYI